MKKHLIAPVIIAAAFAMAACSEAPKPAPPPAKEEPAAKKEPEPTGPVAAQAAFYEMYKPARAWAADLLPLSLVSGEITGIRNEGGKAAMWTAVFVSPGRREARTFFYAAADQGNTVRKGVTAGGAQSWTGATPKSRPFQVTEFSVNSDTAYATAAAKAAGWLKAHPGRKVSLSLASGARFQGPVWYIMWGTAKSGYLAFVNATTGKLMTGR